MADRLAASDIGVRNGASLPAGGPLPRVHVSRDGLTSLLAGILLALFLFYTFIGLNPFPVDDVQGRAAGDVLNRFYSLGMGGLALIIMALRWRLSLMLLRHSWLIWLTVGWCAASISWSAFPGLTLRRALLLVLLTLAVFAIVVSVRSLRHFHTVLAISLSVVMAANVAVVILLPSLAMTEIGARGFYLQKNIAGVVGMIAAFAIATWTASTRRRLYWMIGGTGLACSGLFLLMTGSRTSTALAFGLIFAVPLLMNYLARGPQPRKWFFMAVMLGIAFALLGFFATGLSLEEFFKATIGDATFSGRTYIWRFVLSEIWQKPWLGWGYGAYWDVGLENDPVFRAPYGDFLTEVEVGYLNQAHNGYLDLWVMVGVIGLAFAIVSVLQCLYYAVHLCLDRRSSWIEYTFNIFCLLIMLVYIFNNLMEATLYSRGLVLNSVALLVMFMLHRLWLDRKIDLRMRRASGYL